VLRIGNFDRSKSRSRRLEGPSRSAFRTIKLGKIRNTNNAITIIRNTNQKLTKVTSWSQSLCHRFSHRLSHRFPCRFDSAQLPVRPNILDISSIHQVIYIRSGRDHASTRAKERAALPPYLRCRNQGVQFAT